MPRAGPVFDPINPTPYLKLILNNLRYTRRNNIIFSSYNLVWNNHFQILLMKNPYVISVKHLIKRQLKENYRFELTFPT